MSVSRPRPLRVGDRVRLGDTDWTVAGLDGAVVHLADSRGGTRSLSVAEMQASDGFAVIGEVRSVAPVSVSRVLNGLPAETAELALWWEKHLIEVLTGERAEAEPDARPRPEYDPAQRSLTQREEAKAAELAALGHGDVSVHTIRRKRRRYQAEGLAGVIDHRRDRRKPASSVDPRVRELLQQLIDTATHGSSRTASYFFWKVEQALTDQYGPGTVAMPSQATFYRLFAQLATGRHTTGSARTRRSLANRPAAPFGEMSAARPGELMEIDSTVLDVMVLLDEGVPGRVELTGIVDLATRSITAAVLSPTTKSVDASLLLARTLTPEPMRPGWSDAFSMARSVLPYRHMLELDQRLEQAAARPVITPETIVCDHGKVYVSRNFRSACASLGINFQPAHQDTPTDKPHIERTLGSVATLFCQYVSGYVGSSVERRGPRVEEQPLWSIHELQQLLDEWIIIGWQNRAHDGLRDPSAPGRAFTPNEKYAVLVEAAGYVPVALSADDYVELLPASWRAINAYGIKIKHRKYDCEALNPLRRQDSGVAAKKGLWEVHLDPYDVTRIWVRNHWENGWITVPWTHLSSALTPFGEAAWDHARRQLPAGAVTEAEITQEVNRLFARADRGPETDNGKPTKKDQRVVARTRATNKATADPPELSPPRPGVPDYLDEDHDQADNTEETAEVIPLPVFDARKEAEKWW